MNWKRWGWRIWKALKWLGRLLRSILIFPFKYPGWALTVLAGGFFIWLLVVASGLGGSPEQRESSSAVSPVVDDAEEKHKPCPLCPCIESTRPVVEKEGVTHPPFKKLEEENDPLKQLRAWANEH